MRLLRKINKSKKGGPTLIDAINKGKYKFLDKYVSRYNKDVFIIIAPILITILLIFSIFSLRYVETKQFVDYKNQAQNYHENIDFEDTQSINLTDAELKNDDVIIKYKFNNQATVGDVAQKKIYIEIADNVSETDPIYEGELTKSNTEIKIKTSQIKPRYDVKNKEKELYELHIYYYLIDDLIELSYTNPVQMSVITYDDLYVYEDISDYFEENKSIDEMEREVKYIRRKYLTDKQISEIFTNNSGQIKNVFKKPIETQHLELGTLFKAYQEQYNNYITVLKAKGITDEELKVAMDKTQSVEVILDNLKNLSSLSDTRVEQINSGYMKELNANYNYSTEQINELTKDKTEVEKKKILEEEVSKNKKDEEKTKQEIDKKVKELKKKKVDSKNINKILDNKKLSNKQKLEQLNKLK